jgi:hypothetical protein
MWKAFRSRNLKKIRILRKGKLCVLCALFSIINVRWLDVALPAVKAYTVVEA